MAHALKECKCNLASPPASHAICDPNPPEQDAQTHLSMYVIYLEGTHFLHIIDRVTGCSEVDRISRQILDEQIQVIKRVQLQLHRMSRTIHADREYSKGSFGTFCVETTYNSQRHPLICTNVMALSDERSGTSVPTSTGCAPAVSGPQSAT